jgi:hypothetical protein
MVSQVRAGSTAITATGADNVALNARRPRPTRRCTPGIHINDVELSPGRALHRAGRGGDGRPAAAGCT